MRVVGLKKGRIGTGYIVTLHWLPSLLLFRFGFPPPFFFLVQIGVG